MVELLRGLAFDLENPDPYWSPVSEIRDLGDQAVPLLIGAFRHDEPLIRKMAAFALGQLGWPEDSGLDLTSAIPHLEETLRGDLDPTVRRQAAEALWSICEHQDALQAFLGGLREEDVEERRWGAMMLGLAGEISPIAIRPLSNALADLDLLVRRYAAEALAMHGITATRAIPKLEALLGEDEWTRVIGVQAILKINPSRMEELFPFLAQALGSRSRLVRRQAVEAIRELPNAERMAIPELIDALDDEYEPVRTAALDALENLGPAASPAVPTLIKILRGEGPDGDDLLARGMAADVLASIGEEAQEAVHFLHECLDEPGDDDMTVHFRLRIAHALWLISGESDHLLASGVELLGNANWWLRYRAAATLGDLRAAGRSVIPHLRRLLEDEHPTVRRQATESLERIDPVSSN